MLAASHIAFLSVRLHLLHGASTWLCLRDTNFVLHLQEVMCTPKLDNNSITGKPDGRRYNVSNVYVQIAMTHRCHLIHVVLLYVIVSLFFFPFRFRYRSDTLCDMATKAISSVAFNDLAMPFSSLAATHPFVDPLVASSVSSGGGAAAALYRNQPVFSATSTEEHGHATMCAANVGIYISLWASHFIAKKQKKSWSIASQMPSRSPFRRTALRIRHADSGSAVRPALALSCRAASKGR